MDPRLDYARELERRDAEVAAKVERVVELGRRADALGGRAEMVEAELGRLPDRRELVATAADEAARELAAARAALADAERELAGGSSGDKDEAVRRRFAVAETELRAAEERHARLRARRTELDAEEGQLRSERGELRSLAAELALELERESRLAGLAQPPDGAELADLRDWASRAHTALLVARSGLETERERVVREANELATSVLGESVPTMSAAAVRERLTSTLP